MVARGGRHGRLPDTACCRTRPAAGRGLQERRVALFVLLPLILIIVGFLLGLFELTPPR